MNTKQRETIAAARARISAATRDLPTGKRNAVLNSVDRITRLARKTPARAKAPAPVRPSFEQDRYTQPQLRAMIAFNEETFDEVAVQIGAMAGRSRTGTPDYYDRMLALVNLAGDIVRRILELEDALRRAIQAGRN